MSDDARGAKDRNTAIAAMLSVRKPGPRTAPANQATPPPCPPLAKGGRVVEPSGEEEVAWASQPVCDFSDGFGRACYGRDAAGWKTCPTGVRRETMRRWISARTRLG